MTRTQVYVRFREGLKRGIIKRPESCENCGATEDEVTIMGHHEDYSLPLVVTWLCGSCHQKLHYEKDPGRIERMKKTTRETRGMTLNELQNYYTERRRRKAAEQYIKGAS